MLTLILNLSVLILIWKYINDLKSDKILVTVLVLFSMTCVGILLTNTLHAPIFSSFGYAIGLILSPLLFTFYLLKQKGTKEESVVRKLMLVPTLTLCLIYLFKALHLPAYGIGYFMMIISVLLGGWIVIKKPELKEIYPFQIILIFLIVDILTFLLN
jgi:hypothetical protein